MLLSTGQLLQKYQIQPSKKLGQNFLLDQNVTAKITGFCDDIEKYHIVEIGPGPGSLTQHIIKHAKHNVILIEPDIRFMPILNYLSEEYDKTSQIKIINADALKINLDQEFVGDKYIIISNLPYNISTMLLFHWAENMTNFTQMVLMFQKEVAMRINAIPNTKAYGRISIMMQYLFDIETCYQLAPHYFSPAPKVASTVLSFKPKSSIDRSVYKKMNVLTKHAFANRRKILISNLKSHYDNVEEVFAKNNISPLARAEDPNFTTFINLTNQLI